jgi:putative flippase GtrA
MLVFLKAQLSSLAATAIDFIVTIFLIEVLGFGYLIATINGAVSGATTNFFINKYWSFKQGESKIRTQGFKYAVVWLASISLNVTLSNLAIVYFNTSYILSKTMVAIIIGITFNYTLQKYYVFSNVKETHEK